MMLEVLSQPPICRLLVVKAVERCNLNCSYCYMYNGGDRSYLARPPLMSRDVVEAMMDKVAAHCRRHGLSEFAFVLHGGEPLIAKPRFYRHFVAAAREALEPSVRPIFAIQTNGTLITDEWCELLGELGIRTSFSLDGPRAVNDLIRLDKRGRGSFDRVLAGWTRAKAHGLDPGLLMVIDIKSDPHEVYDFVLELAPSTVDFLFPDATYDKPPPGYRDGTSQTLYADWLLEIFRRWFAQSEREGAPKVRLFLQIIRSLMGKADGYDVIGKGKIEVLVIESDGEIQPLDGLRYCEDGISNTHLNVMNSELDEAYLVPLIRLYHGAHDMLAPACSTCDLREVCGGGFLPHRYKSGRGFDNPSLYCRDLYKLISTIHELVSGSLAPMT